MGKRVKVHRREGKLKGKEMWKPERGREERVGGKESGRGRKAKKRTEE